MNKNAVEKDLTWPSGPSSFVYETKGLERTRAFCPFIHLPGEKQVPCF